MLYLLISIRRLVLSISDLNMLIYFVKGSHCVVILVCAHKHTYLREQNFSIVSVACSLVHQPNANYSCNLEGKNKFNFCECWGRNSNHFGAATWRTSSIKKKSDKSNMWHCCGDPLWIRQRTKSAASSSCILHLTWTLWGTSSSVEVGGRRAGMCMLRRRVIDMSMVPSLAEDTPRRSPMLVISWPWEAQRQKQQQLSVISNNLLICPTYCKSCDFSNSISSNSGHFLSNVDQNLFKLCSAVMCTEHLLQWEKNFQSNWL